MSAAMNGSASATNAAGARPAALFAAADHGASGSAPALIVLGRDDKGRPHASYFGDGEIKIARKAAGLMGMAALPIINNELERLAAKLPRGRVFASGKAFVPFVRAELYGQLLDHLSAEERERLANSPVSAGGDAGGSAKLDDAAGVGSGWDKLKVGTVVIAWESDDNGWWEAVIDKVASNNLFTLRWRGYPDLPPFIRPRKHIALLHSDYEAA